VALDGRLSETVSPLLFDPWAASAYQEVRDVLSGPNKDRPVVSLLLDDMNIYARSQHGVNQKGRFSVLAASESFIDRDQGTRVTRVRLLRAYPSHSGNAYKLLLAELGYVHDEVMANAGKGIGFALNWLAAQHPDQSFLKCLSAYHLRNQLNRQFAELARKCGFQPGDLTARLENWSFAHSEAAWLAWWSDYEARLVGQGVPASSWPNKWTKEIKPTMDAQMPVLDANRILARSTGALEATLFRTVKPSLSGRAQGFGDLARTNRLLDLMTLRANGYFDDLGAVTECLANDARSHGGFMPLVREVTDRRMYRSLLDDTTVATLVKTAGLS